MTLINFIILFMCFSVSKTCTTFGSTVYCANPCDYSAKTIDRETLFVSIGESYDDDSLPIDLRCMAYFPSATVIIFLLCFFKIKPNTDSL